MAIRRDGAMLRVGVTDDGRGGADPRKGSGIVGLRDRAEAAGGRITVVSPRGRGTVDHGGAAAQRLTQSGR